jgi:hypothetical protein
MIVEDQKGRAVPLLTAEIWRSLRSEIASAPSTAPSRPVVVEAVA